MAGDAIGFVTLWRTGWPRYSTSQRGLAVLEFVEQGSRRKDGPNEALKRFAGDALEAVIITIRLI